MTNDYKCRGMTTLFAALNMPDGPSSAATCGHGHQEFIHFLNDIAVP